MSTPEMDDTDRRIIHCLQGDARNVTTADIGDELGIAGSTVANRISQLEEAGIIAGYAPVIDYERSGYQQHHLIVGSVPPSDRDGVFDAIADQSGVVNVTGLLTDERNVVIEAVGEEPADIEALTRSLAALGVTIVRTDIITSEIGRAFDGFGSRKSADDDFSP